MKLSVWLHESKKDRERSLRGPTAQWKSFWQLFSWINQRRQQAKGCKWDRLWVIQLWEYTGSDLSIKAREANHFHSHDRSGCSCMWTWMQRNLLLFSLHDYSSHPPHFSLRCLPSHFEWSMHPVLHELPLWHWHGCYSLTENLVWQKFMATRTPFINLSGKRWAAEKKVPCETHKEEIVIYFKQRYRWNKLFKMQGCVNIYRA